MVTSIFEYLGKSAPISLLSCRLTCHRFKCIVDDMLEKQQMSLWNWSKYYGEARPFIHPGPLRRHLPVNKIFTKSADISDFLYDMTRHLDDDGNCNPFPNRSIYFRRVKSNLPATESDPDNLEAEAVEVDIKKKLGFLGGLTLNDNREENEAYLLSLSKINLLLTSFGCHLTSLIFECAVTADLKSLEELRDILEKTPNLQYLMLKGIRILQKAPADHLQLPQLANLKSVKIIRCHGVTDSIIYAYHNQLETFQVINYRDNYLPRYEKLVQQQYSVSGGDGDSAKRGLIFGKLRELKFGEFGRYKELDQFIHFIKGAEGIDIFPQLDHLSFQYDISGSSREEPVTLTKLFEPLEYLPRLKEFNIGISRSTDIKIEDDEKNGKVNFGGDGGKFIKRLSVPVQFIKYPSLVERLFKKMPGMEMLKFLRHNDNNEAEEFSEAMEPVVDGILNSFPGLKRVEIVDIIGDRENKVCGATRK